MFYDECTPNAAITFIKEVIEYSSNDVQALDLIQSFLDNSMTTTEIENLLY